MALVITTFFFFCVSILSYQYISHPVLFCENAVQRQEHVHGLVEFIDRIRREGHFSGFDAPILHWDGNGKQSESDAPLQRESNNIYDRLIADYTSQQIPSSKLSLFLKSTLFKSTFLLSNLFPQRFIHSIRMMMDTGMGMEAMGRFTRENQIEGWISEKSTFRMTKEVFKSKPDSSFAPQEDLYAWVYYDESNDRKRSSENSDKKVERGIIAVYMHGGGWTLGAPEHHHIFCLELLRKLPAGSVIVNLYYRLAPEYKYPVALEDCVEGLKWAAEYVPKQYNGDANRMIALGDSAGGTQVLSSLLKIRDDNINVNVRYQILIYPCGVFYLHERNRTPSAREFRYNGMFIDEAFVTLTVRHYTPEEYQNDTLKGFNDPYLSPAIGSKFHGLPPTFIYSAEYDMLRSEGTEINAKLLEYGVPSEQFVDPKTIHAMLNLDPQRISSIIAAKVHAFFEQNIFVE